MRLSILLLAFTVALGAAEKYSGPRPPKPDVPYLLHANKLVETETTEARDQQSKQGTVYVISGPAAPARTPLAEPIFLVASEKLNVNALELYRLDVRNGNREITMPAPGKKRASGPRPLRLTVQKIADGLFRVEVSESLDNGQYSLSPSDSNKAFCFEVY
jgi:hypothetical protein